MMILDRRRFIKGSALPLIALCAPVSEILAQGADQRHALNGDDGRAVPNVRLPAERMRGIDRLPGIVWTGATRGSLTLYELYDFNCPYCRKAAKELPQLLSSAPNLRLGLINNPILSLGSIQAAKVELALLTTKGPAAAYKFHQRLFGMPGMNDGARALAVGESMGIPRDRLEAFADSDEIAGMLRTQMKLAADLGLRATPSFVAGDAGLLGYPGPKSVARIVASLEKCGAVVCS